MIAMLRELCWRESDPSTPPWLTIRFWLTIITLAVSVTVLVLVA